MAKEDDHMLIGIICLVASEYGLFLTEAWRYKKHPNDVHGTEPGRGKDLRYRIYPRKIAYEIMDEINNKWQYDPKRPGKQCCIINGKGNNRHLHIQTHQSCLSLKRMVGIRFMAVSIVG